METPATVSATTNATPPSAMPAPSAPVASVSVYPNAPTAKTVAAIATPKLPAESKEQRKLEILSTANDVPIVFYGRLEDQFGNPVTGAEITGTATIINGSTTGANRVSVISDGNGFSS